MKRNTDSRVFTDPVHFLAFGFGSGLAPLAPGTAGTLMAVPLYLLLDLLPLGFYLVSLIAAFLLGIYLCGRAAEDLGVHDHSGIVWDEFVGFWLTMLFAPSGWPWLLLGFLLFRCFDALKPFPISWFDRHIKGGTGIMLDDVVAAVFAGLSLQLIVLII